MCSESVLGWFSSSSVMSWRPPSMLDRRANAGSWNEKYEKQKYEHRTNWKCAVFTAQACQLAVVCVSFPVVPVVPVTQLIQGHCGRNAKILCWYQTQNWKIKYKLPRPSSPMNYLLHHLLSMTPVIINLWTWRRKGASGAHNYWFTIKQKQSHAHCGKE